MADDIEAQIDQMMAADSAGIAPASPGDGLDHSIDQAMAQEALEEKFGKNINQQNRAALEQVGRGATLGLSDLIARKMGVPAEELAARKSSFEKARPGTAAALQIAGGAAPLIATGGLAAPAEALVGKGIQSSLLAGLGEGAAFGAGTAISDDALGDPNVNAQKVLSDVGMGAFLGVAATGAAHGIGKILGKHGSLSGSIADSIDSEAAAAAKQSRNAEALINDGELGLVKNADDLRLAGQELGLQPTNAMLSDDEGKLIATDTLLKGPPTAAAIRQKKIYGDIYNKVAQNMEGVAPATELSENEFGHVLQNSLASKIDEEALPYAETYGKIKTVTENIPLSEKSRQSVAKSIMEIEPVRIDVKAPYSQFARDVAEEIQQPIFDNVDALRAYQSRLSGRLNAFTSPQEKRVVGMIIDKLDELERRTIKKYANDFITRVDLTNPEEVAIWGNQVRDIGMSLQKIDEADKSYGPFREKINGLMGWLGKRKVSGPKDATSFIRNDLEPEDIVKNLWSKKYAGLPEYLEKNFPEQAEMIRAYQKGLLQKEAVKDGMFDVKKFLKSIDKLSKEQRKFLFFDDEIKKINAAKKVMDRFPKAFNFSNTAHTSAWRAFFQNDEGGLRAHSEIPGLLAANVRDALMEKYVNRAVGTKAITNRADEKISAHIQSILGNSGDEGGF